MYIFILKNIKTLTKKELFLKEKIRNTCNINNIILFFKDNKNIIN